MLWFVYAALTAFFESLKDVASKKSLKSSNEYFAAWALSAVTVPLLLPVLFFQSIPHLSEQFWFALSMGGIINAITAILYMKALKDSDVSVTIPMITFTPVFLLLTSPFMVGEFPSPQGIAGIILIVIGSYILNIKERHNGYLAPFKALLKQRGPQLMLCVALLWSISANFDKIGVKNSTPLLWVFALSAFEMLSIAPLLLFALKRKRFSLQQQNYRSLALVGICSTLVLVFQMIALQETLVTYVIAVKRTSALLSVGWAYVLFKEQHIQERFFGALVMIIGVIIIALS